MGELYFIKYENRQLTITDKVNFLNDEIRQIRCLEHENGNENSFIVTGNKGHLKIFSLYENVITIKIELNDLIGNLFSVQSKKGTAIVLSEDGIIYLLEENFGNWYLNDADYFVLDSYLALKMGQSFFSWDCHHVMY